ncbi:DUF3299 domain-containing protein [Rhizobium sp. BK068]|uniref:DUF3299 domain-containing protein n=1 Tax=Rhizobium sp. BK068 TaxID=2512130 RepID=UPI0014049D92|nr:DUF3299 domain-containing protein [Rhizobium sp. BK068]
MQHTAPPPPNQLVHVYSQEPFRLSKAYEIVSIAGALRPGLDKTQLFITDAVKVIEFGYTMGHAQVSRRLRPTSVMFPQALGSRPIRYSSIIGVIGLTLIS